MLNQKIRAVIQQFRDTLPPEMNALIEKGAGEISALDIIERAVRPGDPAPDFTLPNQEGKARRLSDYLSIGPLVLTFYRGAWCPYCNLQLKEYSEHLGRIAAEGATLAAATPEKPDALDILKASGAQQELIDMAAKDVKFDVLQDEGNKLAAAFGVVFTLPESHRRLLSLINVDIEALNGDSSFAFPDPATFIIAPDGKIAWAFVPNNYRRRAEVDDIVNALRRLRAAA